MKFILLSLSFLASSAFAFQPLFPDFRDSISAEGSEGIETASEMDENMASAADYAVDPALEAQRMADIEAAKKTGDQVQFMTPEEILEDMRAQGNNLADFDGSDPDWLFHKAGYAGGALNIDVDISKQRLTMWGTYTPVFGDVVSTAKPGYRTARGTFRPIRLERMWYSRKYDLSPMPYSVFFSGGYALHQTPYVGKLGRPASHGCVRQRGRTARYVYETINYYISKYGRRSVTIRVHD